MRRLRHGWIANAPSHVVALGNNLPGQRPRSFRPDLAAVISARMSATFIYFGFEIQPTCDNDDLSQSEK
jgi:hypothetical protein